MSKKLSRRDFLRMSALTAAGTALAGCTTEVVKTIEITSPPEKVVETKEVEVVKTVEVEVGPETTEVRWFVGLGTGANEEQRDPEYAWTDAFNAQQDEIELTLDIVDNDVAFDTLQTQIAAGTPPDVVGPVGIRGAEEFRGIWLDLTDALATYDMSDFSQGAIDGWTMPEYGLVGLAAGVYPSALYVNNDLFDEAGLDYPPQDYADSGDWTLEALEEAAKTLTVDANGNDANSAAFDPENIVQFGFHLQWTDPRGKATMFGAGSFLADDGVTAECPEHWREAFKFYHRAMWEDYFMPNGPYQGSDILASGNTLDSGNMAMAHCHTWYTCCVGNVPNWDYGTTPSVNGQVTCKLHTDMVGVLKDSVNTAAAVKMVYIIANTIELVSLWGCVPAVQRLQPSFFATLDARFPQGVNWDTILAGLDYVDVPNHESYMPDLAQSNDRIAQFDSLLNDTADLDVDAAIDELVDDLQAIFDAAG